MFPPPEPGSERETRAWKEFREYNEQNPHIWDEFVRITQDLIAQGWKKIGGDLVFRIMRWVSGVKAQGSPWKIDHNHYPYYVREYMTIYPEHEGYFEIRRLTRK